MLGVTLGSDLSWKDHIISVAKAAACKLGFLFRTKRFFTPTQLLTLCKAQIRLCLEYCSHLWKGASKHSLNTLDAIQRRAIWLIGDPALTDTLDSLAHRRSVSALSLFNRYYHGFYSDEIKSINPPKGFDFLRLNTPTGFNWILTEQRIRLFLRLELSSSDRFSSNI